MELILKSDRPLHFGARVDVQGATFVVVSLISQQFYNAAYWLYAIRVANE